MRSPRALPPRSVGRHPAVVLGAALIVGWVLVAALSIGLGLLVTDEIVPADGVASADQSFVESLVDEQTPFLTDVWRSGHGRLVRRSSASRS